MMELDEALAIVRAAGYTVTKKRTPRRAPAAVEEPFAPATDNLELDAWMRAHHSPDWRERQRRALRRTAQGMIPMPSPAPGWPLKPKSASEFSRLFG